MIEWVSEEVYWSEQCGRGIPVNEPSNIAPDGWGVLGAQGHGLILFCFFCVVLLIALCVQRGAILSGFQIVFSDKCILAVSNETDAVFILICAFI